MAKKTLETYILNDVRPLSSEQRVREAQQIFSELTFSHLPVVRSGALLGCLSENDARCLESSQKIKELDYKLDCFYAVSSDHWLEVLERFGRNESNIMPLLNDQKEYLGYYELQDIISFFNDTPFLSDRGIVIAVEHNRTDYSMSELAQIVESNQSSLFGLMLTDINAERAQITLKISPGEVNGVLQTLRRYGYEVLSTIEEDAYLDNLRERSAYLSKYLNI